MEKAKLIVRETAKKKIVAELYFPEHDKTMPFPHFKAKDTSMDGMEVDVERIAGKIVRVQAGEQLLYLSFVPKPAAETRPTGKQHQRPKTMPATTRHDGRMQTQQVEQVRYAAHAPYNFVPLNEKVVTVSDPIPDFDAYHADKNTGWIKVEIETKTPLYIRDTLTQEQDKAGEQSSDFFSPGGKLRIPGSSLRGMIRALVEIVSFGKFGACDSDKLLYFRGLADKSNLRKEYQERMSSYDRKARRAVYKMSAGVLRRRKNSFNYEILPSGHFTSILKKEARENVQQIGQRYAEFNFYKLPEGYLVVSGDMQNKKRDWLIDFPESNAKSIPIPEDDVRNYQNDITRAEDVPDLISLADKGHDVPCFYVIWADQQGNDRVSFGHTAMFRLAYKKTIGEHLPQQLITNRWEITEERLGWMQKSGVSGKIIKQLRTWERKEFSDQEALEKQLAPLVAQVKKNKQEQCKKAILKHAKVCGFAEAIFGNETTFAGRVFFEDAFLQEGQQNVRMGEGTPKILSSPKPTTFQHYLVQTSDNNRQLNHYSRNSAIRGNKLYWHKSGEHWQEKNQQEITKHRTQYTKINPVKPGIKFIGHIRFENLSDQELGALLFALELPEGCCHKLGMGKPLGLGSVHIKPLLYLSRRRERYEGLFCECREDISPPERGEEFKERFAGYILGKLGLQGSLWNTERLKELQIMLDYEKGKALEAQGKIRYMEIERKKGTKKENEFKNRPILPLPGNV